MLRYDEQKAELLCQRGVALGSLAEHAMAIRSTDVDALQLAVKALRAAAKQLAFVGAEGPALRAQELATSYVRRLNSVKMRRQMSRSSV